ncbi:hypothetical protein Goshw_026237 [Gossypium schwendimanii]|uniref:Uncharacterized protein n=1 Tax=Gossypium schwendimanii TaxID=34291 RepID=A0A7J9KNH9_GOSSC|nr:hypothetical protein [Gossypium schwendimanii]
MSTLFLLTMAQIKQIQRVISKALTFLDYVKLRMALLYPMEN